MKERPILFSAPMIRAILDGSKTQTRRVCKPAEEAALSAVVGPFDCPELGPGHFGDEEGDLQFLCPYGQPGDRLWVRETFCQFPEDARDGNGAQTYYRASQIEEQMPEVDRVMAKNGVRWKPSIHMPRAASRILLEIVSVRVERLNDISEANARAEGAEPSIVGADLDHLKYRAGYQTLWETINGAGSWDANPWVWVISFRRIDAS